MSSVLGKKIGPADVLRPRIGLFGAVFLVIGGMVGVGIFVNPATAAADLNSPLLDMAAWFIGGCIAVLGALVYAELAACMPLTGGEYIYLRNAYGSLPAFLFGWTTFLVVQAGSLAAVAIIFSKSMTLLLGVKNDENDIVVILLCALAVLNCLGVVVGNFAQLTIGVMKVAVFFAIVLSGFLGNHLMHASIHAASTLSLNNRPHETLHDFGAALVPVLFTFGGWQTANYMGGEIKDSSRTLSFSLILGTLIVVFIYWMVNIAMIKSLGFEFLRGTNQPTSDLLMLNYGAIGEKLAAGAIALSALGFLSQSIMTGPRIYFAMARDGLFLNPAANVNQMTGAPIFAILFQVAWAIFLALSNSYAQLLSYVVSVNFLFFAISASTIFKLRAARSSKAHDEGRGAHFQIPLHPWTTLIFIIACLGIVGSAVWSNPVRSFIGFGIMAIGILPYFYWRSRNSLRFHHGA